MENKEKFAHFEGLFWGDIDFEEQEISWIEQVDLSPVLDAMPLLNNLKIKGTNNLSIGKKPRPNLKSLEIISGGLPDSVVEDILGSDLPNLEKLVLYVGVEDYGFDGDMNVFRPLFSKDRFPNLKWLGIVDAEEQNTVVEMFLESDILPQLETMDISAGVLTDEGARLLLDHVDKIKHLKFINMKYNYLSGEMKKELQKSLPMKIDVSDSQEYDDDYSYPMITGERMRILVASNSTSKRTDYFIKAGRSLGADTCFVTYDELSAVLPDCRDTVVKLEPPVFREADFRKYNLLCEEYRSLLSRLADMDKSESVHFLNEPAAILCALDKVYTQRKLTGAGLKTTPLLSDALSTFDDLAAILCRQKREDF